MFKINKVLSIFLVMTLLTLCCANVFVDADTTIPLVNLARISGAQYLATSEHHIGLLAEYAFDGDKTGVNNRRWAPKAGAKATEEYLQIDFGKSCTYNTIKIYVDPNNLWTNSMTIITSDTGDENDWNTVETISFSKGGDSLKICELSDSITSRYLRLNFGTSDNRGANIVELEIFQIPIDQNEVKQIEDFEQLIRIDPMTKLEIPGNELVEGQSRNLIIYHALSGDKSVELSSVNEVQPVTTIIAKSLGQNHVALRLKNGDIASKLFMRDGLSEVFSTSAQGFLLSSQAMIELIYDSQGSYFTIPADFDGCILIENTANKDLESLSIGVIGNKVIIDNISSCASIPTDAYSFACQVAGNITVYLQALKNRDNQSATLKWSSHPFAESYNIYKDSVKVATGVVDTVYSITDLVAQKPYKFTVKAVEQGLEIKSSNESWISTRIIQEVDHIEYYESTKNVAKLPHSDLFLNAEFVGYSLTDPEYNYWCTSAIKDDEGKVHLFNARWPSKYGFDPAWRHYGELTHFVSDHPEGPFEEKEVIFTTDNLVKGIAPHNTRVKKIGNTYCLIFIVQLDRNNTSKQRICMATSPSLNGPWELVGNDGIVLEPAGWTILTTNPDIIKVGNQYRIYFKGKTGGITRYGLAIADNINGPYTITDEPVTDNIKNIEDAMVFEWNGKMYLLSTDNHGDHTGVGGCGILWESDNGLDFKINDAEIAFGKLNDYINIPYDWKRIYGVGNKFERPALLIEEGQPTYFYAPIGAQIYGMSKGSQSLILKIKDFDFRYKIKIGDVGTGVVATDKVKAKSGETVRISVIEPEGYSLVALKVNNGDITIGDDRTFTMPSVHVTITAEFEVIH